jgi:cation:H+ antiporter
VEHVALFVLGLVLLAVGAPMLVFGSARLDRRIGRGPFAVGAVALAFGPCVAALALDLAIILREPPVTRFVVGELIGNSVASIGLVLGAAALVRPVAATARLFYTAIPLVLVAALLFWLLAFGKRYSQVAAGALLGAFVVIAAVLGWLAKRESGPVKAELAGWVPEQLRVRWAVLLALAGLAAIFAGARLTAEQLIGTANYLKAPSILLGCTLGAFVTALPALAAAVLAARRGRYNLVLGLVVGPVLVNVLLVTGAVAMIKPLLIDPWVLQQAVPAVPLFASLLVPVLLNGLKVPRWEGALLLVAYVAFVVWQVRRVTPT